MMPTTPHGVTAQGTILGTFQYMAPEQIEGLEADGRTDIFAFGALIFEMLTGRTAFEGKTRASLLGAILKDEPPRVSTVQPLAPAALDRIVARCLAKDPDDRYQSARDLLHDLRWIASDTAAAPTAVTVTTARVGGAARTWESPSSCRSLWQWPASSPGNLAAPAQTAEPIQFTITPPPNTSFAPVTGGGTGLAPLVAVSPDGRLVAFVGSGQGGYQLWLRTISGLDARAVAGTAEAMFPSGRQ
jgi:serine/threonine protein kinase